MRKICSYPGCNTPVEVDDFDRSSPRCPAHPATHTPKKRYSHHYHNGKNIYHGYKWKKLRQAYIEHQPICEHCLRFDIYEPANMVDHVKEVKDGGEPYDWNNLQSLCWSCHRRKTAAEAKKRNNSGEFKSLSDF